jgi:2-methylisocitrate lyase-like PEP mutase family enzyme
MVGKLKAALDARPSEDVLIIARTDAIAVEGFAAALDRAEAYAQAGVDLLFIEAPRNDEELAGIARRFAGRVPVMANMVEGGKTPLLSAAELEALGYKLAIFASDVQRAAIYGMRGVLKVMKRDGTPEPFAQTIDFPERDAIIGLEQVQALEERFLRL